MPYANREFGNAWQKLTRIRNKNKGVCPRCKNFHGGASINCKKCTENAKKWKAKRNYGKKYRERMEKENKCQRCSTPLNDEVDKDYKTCINCRMRKEKDFRSTKY